MFLKKLFCKHKNKKCITNIYGDLRNDFDCMSIWECENCGKLFLNSKLNRNCKVINFNIIERR